MDGEVNATQEQATVDDIGREFVRQYYTALSEQPEGAFRFYGHESVFSREDVSATGQSMIQKAIEDLRFHDSKVRVYSLKASHTLVGGIVLQVAGEFAFRNAPMRRFAQTFVLGPQGSGSKKRFYVHNDLFQYHDTIFEVPIDSAQPNEIQAHYVKLNGQLYQKGTQPSENGTADLKEGSEDEQAVVKKTEPAKEKSPTPVAESPPETPVLPTLNGVSRQEYEQTLAPNAQGPKTTPQKQATKTWANILGGGAPKDPIHPKPATNPTTKDVRVQQQQQQPVAPKVAAPNHHIHDSVINRKLYVSNIGRHLRPENTFGAENELKKAFSVYGEVESVNVPRKVLEFADNRGVFAFVTMKTPADAANVLSAGKPGERGAKLIRVSVPSFGFDDDVHVSEQRDKPLYDRNAPITNHPRRNGYPQGQRGAHINNGFVPRGARGGGGRGGRGGSVQN